jgi:hypothetical protein
MRRSAVLVRVPVSLALAACVLFLTSPLHAQANFFQGKSLRIIRGGQPGDLYDLWTRHIATYLGKHIPGTRASPCRTCPAPVR